MCVNVYTSHIGVKCIPGINLAFLHHFLEVFLWLHNLVFLLSPLLLRPGFHILIKHLGRFELASINVKLFISGAQEISGYTGAIIGRIVRNMLAVCYKTRLQIVYRNSPDPFLYPLEILHFTKNMLHVASKQSITIFYCKLLQGTKLMNRSTLLFWLIAIYIMKSFSKVRALEEFAEVSDKGKPTPSIC